jgi:Sulfatase
MKKQSAILHPFLMAAYPLLFLYSNNIGQFYPHVIVKPLLVILVSTLVVWGFLGFVLRNYHKAGIVVSVFLFLFFSYGHFKPFIGDRYSTQLILLVWLLLLLLCIFLSFRLKESVKKWTYILNIVTGVLVVFTLITIVLRQSNSLDWSRKNDFSTNSNEHFVQKKGGEYHPDIYFIVLDAYARDDVLKELYNFDNNEFLEYLRKKGFYIAENSAANYCQTGLSLGSCFNLCYLDDIVKKYIGRDCLNRAPLKELISESIVIRFLKKHGYSIVSFATGVFETEIESADYYLLPGEPINTFLNALKNNTPLPDIALKKKNGSELERYRKNILYIFESLPRVAQLNRKPKFIFAHIEVPHPPFVFGPNGEPVSYETALNDHDGNWLISPGRLTLEEYRKAYREQLIFTNIKMRRVVAEILSNSKVPSLLFIIGDHGPRSGTIWEDPTKTNMKECLTNLNACYLPGLANNQLYSELTPVNFFPIVFNKYFGQKIKLRPDKSYFSTAKYLYRFHDVSEQVKRVSN